MGHSYVAFFLLVFVCTLCYEDLQVPASSSIILAAIMQAQGHRAGQSAGTCPLKHMHFHGFAWKESNISEPGQPLVLIFDHDRQHPIDRVWVAKLAKCYLRKDRTKTIFSDKHLAFQTYKKDMAFNGHRGHTLLYQTAEVFWLAIHKAHSALSEPTSDWSRINNACASVGYDQVDMWDVPEKAGPTATAAPGSSNPPIIDVEAEVFDEDEEEPVQADIVDEDESEPEDGESFGGGTK
jgi:hypothetical protein